MKKILYGIAMFLLIIGFWKLFDDCTMDRQEKPNMQVFRYTFVCFLLKSVKVGLVLGVKCVLLVYNKTCGRWKSVHLNNMPDSGGRRLLTFAVAVESARQKPKTLRRT